MKTFVFCGKYGRQVLEKASSLGRTYWSDCGSLRELLQNIPAAEVIFVHTGHVDIEMLEDSPRLRGLVCSKEILQDLELSAVSALGVVTLQMPSSCDYSAEWEMLFQALQQLLCGQSVSAALNPEVYHHPDWNRAKKSKEGMKL